MGVFVSHVRGHCALRVPGAGAAAECIMMLAGQQWMNDWYFVICDHGWPFHVTTHMGIGARTRHK